MFVKASSGGGKIASGTDTFNPNGAKTIQVGFEPKQIFIYPTNALGAHLFQIIYDKNVSPTKCLSSYGQGYSTWKTIGDSSSSIYYFWSIYANSFGVVGPGDSRPFSWVALG